MSAGKVFGYVVCGILVFLGLFLMLAGFSPEYGDSSWITWGIIIAIIGVVGIIVISRIRGPQGPQEIVQQIDLSGDIDMERLRCRECGALLEQESITVKAGAVLVSCPYCGSDYQIIEEPKW